MTSWMQLRRARSTVSILLLAAACLVWFPACSKEEEPVAPAVVPPSAEAPAAKEAPALPVLAQVLQLRPETTMAAVAFTSAADIYDNAIGLMRRFAPVGTDVNAIIGEAVQEVRLKGDFGDADSFPDMLRHEGIDPDAPAGIFVSVSSTLKSLEAAAPPAEAPEASEAPEATGAPEAPEAATPEQKFEKAASQLSPPEVAVVLGVADRAALERMIAENVAKAAETPATPEEIVSGDTTFYSYGPDGSKDLRPTYFFAGGRAVIGSSLEFVQAVAARMAAPAPVRYGTDEMPASPDDKMAALIRMDMIAPIIDAGLPFAESISPELGPIVKMQMATIERMRKAYEGDDPMVVTAGWTEDRLEMLTRIDLKTHPAMVEVLGEVKPLRLAKAYPENTSAMLAVRFNEQLKAQIEDAWLNSMPQNMQDNPQAFQALMMLKNFMGVLGDELVIGVTGAQTLDIPSMGMPNGAGQPSSMPIPRVLLTIGLAEPDTLKGLLLMLPSTTAETYNEVEIKEVALPVPVKIHYAIAGNTFIMGSDLVELKDVMGRLQNDEVSGLFASMDPPLAVDQPRFSLFFVKGSLYEAFSGLTAGNPQLAQYLGKATGQLRLVESRQEIVDEQVQSRLTVYFSPMQ